MSTSFKAGLLSAASVLAVSIASARAGAQSYSWNMYQSETSLVVPYIAGNLNSRNPDGSFSNHTANLAIQVAGASIPVTIDTGSTGIAISQALLPSGALNGLTPLGTGAINYDSSGATPTGTFYQLPISILGGKVNGQAAVGTTSVKVLVVTNDNGTAYFGIGNNRNNVYSGLYNPSLTFQQNVAQGNITQIPAVGMNPLIDVAVNGTALPNQGYVVMNNQIVVGLTKANNTYSFVKLTPDTAPVPCCGTASRWPSRTARAPMSPARSCTTRGSSTPISSRLRRPATRSISRCRGCRSRAPSTVSSCRRAARPAAPRPP